MMSDERKPVNVSARIAPEDYDLLVILAERTERSVAYWQRKAISLLLTTPDVLEILGLQEDNGNVTPLPGTTGR